jgi:chemotaxis regulatin CheY-phosphate phosphatase CheZ
MTTNRARAYGRVMTLIDELGAAKLHPGEQQAIRDAADALLFSMDVASDAEAKEALDRLDDVVDRLVAAERLTEETADALLDAVEACGPQTEPLAVPSAA